MIEALLAALCGLVIGSFLNVCIYRLPLDLSIVRPSRSFCPACEAQIAWYDNIPVLSYLLLKGRCRKCAARISLRYPVVELLTAVLFFASVLMFGLTLLGIKLCTFCAIQVALVFSDLEERILPDEFTLGGTAAGILIAAYLPQQWGFITFLLYRWQKQWLVSMLEAAFAAGLCALVLWSVGALYQKVRHREGLGLGDVKMVAMIGAFLGLQGALLTMIVGSVLGSIIGLGYILLAKKDASSYGLPFGSFLGAAAVAVAFYLATLQRAAG